MDPGAVDPTYVAVFFIAVSIVEFAIILVLLLLVILLSVGVVVVLRMSNQLDKSLRRPVRLRRETLEDGTHDKTGVESSKSPTNRDTVVLTSPAAMSMALHVRTTSKNDPNVLRGRALQNNFSMKGSPTGGNNSVIGVSAGSTPEDDRSKRHTWGGLRALSAVTTGNKTSIEVTPTRVQTLPPINPIVSSSPSAKNSPQVTPSSQDKANRQEMQKENDGKTEIEAVEEKDNPRNNETISHLFTAAKDVAEVPAVESPASEQAKDKWTRQIPKLRALPSNGPRPMLPLPSSDDIPGTLPGTVALHSDSQGVKKEKPAVVPVAPPQQQQQQSQQQQQPTIVSKPPPKLQQVPLASETPLAAAVPESSPPKKSMPPARGPLLKPIPSTTALPVAPSSEPLPSAAPAAPVPAPIPSPKKMPAVIPINSNGSSDSPR